MSHAQAAAECTRPPAPPAHTHLTPYVQGWATSSPVTPSLHVAGALVPPYIINKRSPVSSYNHARAGGGNAWQLFDFLWTSAYGATAFAHMCVYTYFALPP